MTQPGNGLRGRAALVTGAGRGIGRATALCLAAAGVRVALVARSVSELTETAQKIDAAGGDAVVIPADLGDPAQLASVVPRAQDQLGVVDILVNNAAVVAPLGASNDVDPSDWSAALAVNVVAPATLSFAVLSAMRAGGWGRIVNVSSAVVAHPAAMPGMNAYVASKAALEAHTLNLAAELVGTGVTVNVFRPGSVDTAMQAWIREQDPTRIGAALHDWFVTSHRQQTLITPETSAQALVAHLHSDATGEVWDLPVTVTA